LVEAIAEKRGQLGLSQREMSRRLGLHEMTMFRIESEQRGIDVAELLDIAAILGVDPIDLLKIMIDTDTPDTD
jgi:transcriptional regulator with XRE-family HTH domain